MLSDTDYEGTLSNVPSRNDESARPGARERRGKYRANAVQPRTYAAASKCVSYRPQPDGTIKIAIFDPRASKVRKHTKVATVTQAPQLTDVQRFADRLDNAADYNN